MNNYSAKGYLKKALNFMLKENLIDGETAQNVLNQYAFELDLMTEKDAEEYYCSHFLEEK